MIELGQITIDVPHGNSAVPTIVGLFQKYPLVGVLLALMLVDILTGVLAGLVGKKLCSTASYRGMVGKVMILAMVGTGMLFEVVVPQMPWGQIIAFFFVITECISITENAANAGVPIPKQWMEALKKARQDAEEKSLPVQAAPLVNVNINESSGEKGDKGETGEQGPRGRDAR